MPTVQELFETPYPIAFVTGSVALRVGRVIAAELEKMGCKVVLHAHHPPNSESSTESIGNNVVFGAIEDESAVDRMVGEILERHQRIDIVVNSAAIWSPLPLEQVTAEVMRRFLEVNTLGTFLVSKIAGLQMVRQSCGGAIVNLGDWATSRPYLDHAGYFPSKGAIPTLTRSLAVELGHRNPSVRVNAILPGPVLLTESVTPAQKDALSNSTLTKRIGTPQSIAHAVRFLIENDFVTGVCLPVDGGRTIFADEPTQIQHRCG